MIRVFLREDVFWKKAEKLWLLVFVVLCESARLNEPTITRQQVECVECSSVAQRTQFHFSSQLKTTLIVLQLRVSLTPELERTEEDVRRERGHLVYAADRHRTQLSV